MQTNVAVANGAITGTLKHLSSGALVDRWGAGNFIALKFTSNLAPEYIRAGLDPSYGGGLVPLDEDMNGAWKVTDKDNQVFVVESYDGESWNRETYSLSGLTVLSE